MIRDGRDCAISNERQRWTATLPWDARRRIGVAALFWEWMVRAGRRYAREHPGVCLDVRFEDLLADPRRVLHEVGRFIDHDLDYERIAANPVHALKAPNTSFRDERTLGGFNPIGRWQRHPSDDIRLCEALIGPYLEELGYQRASERAPTKPSIRTRQMRALYLGLFTAKHLVKAHTPIGGFITSTRVWHELPRTGEDPVRGIPAAPPAAVDQPSGVSR